MLIFLCCCPDILNREYSARLFRFFRRAILEEVGYKPDIPQIVCSIYRRLGLPYHEIVDSREWEQISPISFLYRFTPLIVCNSPPELEPVWNKIAAYLDTNIIISLLKGIECIIEKRENSSDILYSVKYFRDNLLANLYTMDISEYVRRAGGTKL